MLQQGGVESSTHLSSSVLDLLLEQEGDSPLLRLGQVQGVLTQSCFNGLMSFLGRYIQLIHTTNKPTLKIEIFKSLCQMFDYYISYVFHCFVSVDQRQRLLCFSKQNGSSPSDVRDFRSLRMYISSLVESSEVFSGDESGVSVTSGCVDTQQQLRYDEDSIDKTCVRCLGSKFFVNQHLVAAESCWFLARIMKEMKSKFLLLLPAYYSSDCSRYVFEFQQIVGQLHSLIYRGLSHQLCSYNVRYIAVTESPVHGAQKTPTSETSRRIEMMVNNCKQIWHFLHQENEYSQVYCLGRDQLWLELVQAAYDMAVTIFSKAKNMSAAQMSLCLSTLQALLDGVHPCKCPQGYERAEEYLRAFGLSETALFNWVRENWSAYPYHTLYMLLYNVVSKPKLREGVALIDRLYAQIDTFGQSPFTSPDRSGTKIVKTRDSGPGASV